ncbi:hypothetical protein Pmani_014804 [Petrolisthes manimaculis]|uniref:BZIP domain-containing protein n=1 Tax=Petrolisthes manimaculis TaxID=1843537 RepID=A0AAE1PUQ4_9EUCA|nr:hypothetical protein Pmani_014804 [Petrolisthes manimaculis]
MEKKNNGKFGGARSKGPREVLSASPAPPSPQSFLTPTLDLSGQPYDVNGLRQSLWNNQYLPPTDYTVSSNHHTLNSGFTTDHSLNSGFSPDSGLTSTDHCLDSGFEVNLDYGLTSTNVNSHPDIDFDLISYVLDEESNTSQESVENERWTPGNEWNLESQLKQTSVIYHQDQMGAVGGTTMGALTSSVLPGTSDQLGAVGGTTTGHLTSYVLSEARDQFGTVGNTTLEELTSTVLPVTRDHFTFHDVDENDPASPFIQHYPSTSNGLAFNPSSTLEETSDLPQYQGTDTAMPLPGPAMVPRDGRKGYQHRYTRQYLPEGPEKELRQRQLNNEASRLRNKKKKEEREQLQKELEQLQQSNADLKSRYAQLKLLHQKFPQLLTKVLGKPPQYR